jgi:Ni2+-binding GTPase involved in maturation of urease and hydrogenase
MDPRLEAFKSPEFDRVFGAVASLAGAADEERLDVPEIEQDADDALAAVVAQARAQNPDPASRILLVKGQTGTGKTHTLLTAIRRMHGEGGVYAVLFPMVDIVSERDLDLWLLRALIARLSERHLVAKGSASPLVSLAQAMVRLANPDLARNFQVDLFDNGEDVRDLDLRPLVLSIRSALQKAVPSAVPSEGFIAALIGSAAGDEDALMYLRGQPVAASLGGVRLTQENDEHVARLHLDAIVNVIGATGGALFLAFDQLEQSRAKGWQDRLCHLITRGVLLAETLPPLAVAYAVLPALYDTFASGIDPSIRDRIERFGALPVRLKTLGRRHVEALLKRRLSELYARCGTVMDPAQPLYPFPAWMMEELSGQTSRYVFEMVQQFRRAFIAKGALPELDDMPPPPVISDELPPMDAAPAINFDDKWNGELITRPAVPEIATGLQQAELLEWAIQAAAVEIEGVTEIKTRRVSRGRSTTVVIEADFQKDGKSLEKREIALCNETRGSPLAEEIKFFLRQSSGSRPVIVRPRGGKLPRTGRFIAPLMREADDMGAIIVSQFELIAWERLESAKHFFRLLQDLPGFEAWQKQACPLTNNHSFADIVQFPYAKAAPEAAPDPIVEFIPEVAPPPRRAGPSAPAIMLGDHVEDGGQVHWAPFETDRKLLNFGVLVTGDPGSGKTQTLNVLIDGVVNMGFPVCIFDFKNDYSERSFVSALNLRVHDVRRHGIPFNPLMPSASEDGLAQPIEHIFTITGVLRRVFGLGDRQTATLRDAMKEAFEQRGIDPRKWVDAETLRPPSFNDVVAILSEQKEAKNPQAISLLDRIAPLFELGLFPTSNELGTPFEAMLDERLVLSLFALPNDEIKAALAELIIIRLHGVLVRRAQPRKLTRLLVLDEAWRVANSTHLENLAREGRAFGAGIAIGTQYPGDLPPDLSGALDTKIYLKNQQPDHKKAVVRALCGANSGPDAQHLHGILERLSQFEGIIQNQQYLPYARFKLVPYFARGAQTPKAA